LRTNIRNSGAEFIESKPEDWVFHQDETVDVAVMPMKGEPGAVQTGFMSDLDIKIYRMSPAGLATAAVLANEGIGPGDEVFIIGLFRNRPGKLRNIPIARIGNISALAGEPINARKWHNRDIEAHLIEARSVGGLSGSPVFAHLGPIRMANDQRGIIPGNVNVHFAAHRSGPHFLFGLVHGHFDLNIPDTDEVDTANRLEVNSGIAIVVPVEKIVETLNQPAVSSERRRVTELLAKQISSTLDIHA
jgi:hypothetical protein